MEPLTVTAYMQSGIIPGGPLLLDGILYAGLGAKRGLEHPSGRVDPDLVYLEDLPLARVETEAGWWWAASQAVPEGPENVIHMHRRPPDYLLWSSKTKSICIVSGPDKTLRIPYYQRTGWRAISWSCVGDLSQIRDLLQRIPSIGRRTTDGFGWIARWNIRREGPALEEYARRLDLRPIPAALDPIFPEGRQARVVRRPMRLRPPYYSAADLADCLQIQTWKE